jgi:hypothetical protein
MSTSQQVHIIGQAFVQGLQRILGDKLYGAYIYGAAAFPEDVPSGDIDFHVILTCALTEDERSVLEALHEELAQRFPPLGGELDGYYILLADARGETPPQSQMWSRATDNSWALHRAHILAGRHIVLHGPDPREIYSPPTWPQIEEALRGELDYVAQHLQDYPDYCILNLCRLIYSYETRDVVISKAAAAAWAYDALPGWRRHVELAQRSYAGQATTQERLYMVAEVRAFFDSAQARIQRVAASPPAAGGEDGPSTH